MTPRKNVAKAALYLRVSTDEQTTANQERELREAADAKGLEIAHIYRDNGISGAKGRDKRPGFDAMLKAAAKREFDLLAVWSSDRLGRSMPDLIEVLQMIRTTGRELYIHTQALDTSTPAGKLVFTILGAVAELERSLIAERVRAGLRNARANGKKLGRPRKVLDASRIASLRIAGRSWRGVAREIGVSERSLRRLALRCGKNPIAADFASRFPSAAD